MPIWFHSLTILPGSAAGAAALKSGDGNMMQYVIVEKCATDDAEVV
jgi:hypothetical protein